jgi:beta-1,4-mannosyl-glycoprotein beta-1,4-N-acetylglucosaminyltransferase
MIIDTFLYFNELALLKVRLEYLGPVVDQFIIIEGRTDFSGRERKLELTNNIISNLPYSKKIKVIFWSPSNFQRKILFPLARITKFRKVLWSIQNQQRDYLLNYIKTINGNPFILFGDLDEIPCRNDITQERLKEYLKEDRIVSFSQSYYYFNIFNLIDLPWTGTILTQANVLHFHRPSYLRKERGSFSKILSGWHFSYFGPAEFIQHKIKTIARAEKLASFEKMSINEISKKISNGSELFNRSDHTISQLTIPIVPPDLLLILDKYIPNLCIR